MADRTASQLTHELIDDPTVRVCLHRLWGKSPGRAGGSTHLLVAHLLDTAAVGEVLWEEFVPPRTRAELRRISGGDARRFFAWLCGLHDVGKATPAFQTLDPELADTQLRRHGVPLPVVRHPWRHDRAGGRITRDVLSAAGWQRRHLDWLWPLIAGHHGAFCDQAALKSLVASGPEHGHVPPWPQVQHAVVAFVTQALGYPDLLAPQPAEIPVRAIQLQLSGLIIMADWIASDQRHFPGIANLSHITLATSRQRAAHGWQALGLRGGWRDLAPPGPQVIPARFGVTATRPSQQMAVTCARQLPEPGMLIIEAPMGEGKTEAALAAAEVLAARSGADGVFVGMPTQATCDPMFARVRRWAAQIDPTVPVALLHGKRRVSPQWRRLLEETNPHLNTIYAGVDEDGEAPDPEAQRYGLPASRDDDDRSRSAESQRPAEWLLGPKRGLLTPIVVGTIDQLLFAATRTRHVALRFAGLAGKVVVLDEIHACDVYMSQFLEEALWWLGQAHVPVVLLSATLAPHQRRDLVARYLTGWRNEEYSSLENLPPLTGYPAVTAACVAEGQQRVIVDHAPSWRAAHHVGVRVLDVAACDDTELDALANLLSERLADGGVALVIRNTVSRAQRAYQRLAAEFPPTQVRLLHGRLTAGDRAQRAEECLRLLSSSRARPHRLIVVATQVAEQSFDIDADLLVTDLAPTDLLLQRVGRLHRHDRDDRPPRLRAPQVVVTGLVLGPGHPPLLDRGCEAVYGRHLLLRAAAQVCTAISTGWSVPTDVPRLVAELYTDPASTGEDAAIVPGEWAAEAAAAAERWQQEQSVRADSARRYLLAEEGRHVKATLAGLHAMSPGSTDDDELRAVVRDGDPTVDVVLVRHDGAQFTTRSGRPLGPNGERSVQEIDELLSDAVRLPPDRDLIEAVREHCPPLPAWGDDPWLRHMPAVVLDRDGAAGVLGRSLRYDDVLGLQVSAT